MSFKVPDNSKANKAQEAWVAASLQNSWVDFGGTRPNAEYYKDEFGIVHLHGSIKNGTQTDATTLFTLPAGYRPAGTISFVLPNTSADIAKITIASTGVVSLYGAAPYNTILTLDGVSFRIA